MVASFKKQEWQEGAAAREAKATQKFEPVKILVIHLCVDVLE